MLEPPVEALARKREVEGPWAGEEAPEEAWEAPEEVVVEEAEELASLHHQHCPFGCDPHRVTFN